MQAIVPHEVGALTGWAEAQETNAHFEDFKAKMKVVFMALAKRNQELAERFDLFESKSREETLLKDAKIENLSARVAQLEAMVAAKDKQIAQITEKSVVDLKASIAERAQAVQTAVNNTQQACNSQLASARGNGSANLANLVSQIQGIVTALDGDINWYAARGEGRGVLVPPHGWNAYMAVNHIKGPIESLLTTAKNYLSQS